MPSMPVLFVSNESVSAVAECTLRSSAKRRFEVDDVGRRVAARVDNEAAVIGSHEKSTGLPESPDEKDTENNFANVEKKERKSEEERKEEKRLCELPEEVVACLDEHNLIHPDSIKEWTSKEVERYIGHPILVSHLPSTKVMEVLADKRIGCFGPFGGEAVDSQLDFDRVANLEPWMEFDPASPFYRHRRFEYKKFNASVSSRWFNNDLDRVVGNHITMRMEAVVSLLLKKGMSNSLIRKWCMLIIEEETFGISGYSFKEEGKRHGVDNRNMFHLRNLVYWCLCDLRRCKCPCHVKDTLELICNKTLKSVTKTKKQSGEDAQLLNFYIREDEWPMMNLSDAGAKYYFDYAF